MKIKGIRETSEVIIAILLLPIWITIALCHAILFK